MQTLYRKYRPTKFCEVSGQTHIIRTLTNAIKNDRVGQAYLLTGPRGTGKTTLARIFAKAINCKALKLKKDKAEIAVEPCNKCDNCKLVMESKAMDLVEIDAASHTGVDNIRQLRETIPLPPSALKKKVYLIDEVHMLSIGAFNALLKTLEEPPAHAVFILATTELHKVPETIVSRCQRFDISNLTQEQIVQRLKQIAKSEKVKIEDEALETIAIEAEGGMRDAESLLGQIISLEDESITAKEVNEILGTSSKRVVIEFASSLIQNDSAGCIERINQLQNEGINLKNFNKLLLSFFRSLLLVKSNPSGKNKLVAFLSKEQLETAKKLSESLSMSDIVLLLEIFQKSLERFKETTIPQLPVEMAVIQWNLEKNPEIESKSSSAEASEDKPEIESRLPVGEARKLEKEESAPQAKPEHEKETPTNPEPAEKNIKMNKSETVENETAAPQEENTKQEAPRKPSKNIHLDDVLEKWGEILEGVKPHNHSIHAFLKNCTPCGTKDGTVYIKTKYDFYKDKLSEMENSLTVQKVIGTIFDTTVKVVFLTEKECASVDFSQKDTGNKKNVLHDAMQVFGGKIVK